VSLFNAGQEPTDAEFNELNEPGWDNYASIAWSSSGTQPVVNNGTLVGRYRQPTDSDLILFEFGLIMGGTTTYGTGTYFISVPVTPSVTSVAYAVGACYILDSGTLDKAAVCKFQDNTKLKIVTATVGVATPTIPQTFATNDQIHGVILYEPA
jgi:hypothetical protein